MSKSTELPLTISEQRHLKQRCHAQRMECIWNRDGSGTICIRPMLFDDEDRQIVTLYPEPSEFKPLEKALLALEANQ